MTEETPEKSPVAKREEETLAFWRENKTFKKTLKQTEKGAPFVFYDGPPFATGLPHYGHILPGTIKDVLPRYQTMKGRFVRRVWGWDCHGLPVENLIEKELGLASKKDIEEIGIAKFNQAARESVLRYDTEWKDVVPRTGRWIDMENSYETMDSKYTESVWWAFKTLYDKGLVYEGYKSMHICPRCETTLAISEVGMNYQDVKDITVTAKFELVDEPGTYFLAWTTTPWTLPGNVALAVGADIEYVKVQFGEEKYYLAKERVGEVFKDQNTGEKEAVALETVLGKDLAGKAYKPVFDYYARDEKLKNHENGWRVYAADFVTTDAGTGIVHIAPAFGEDDMNLGREKNLPFVQHVGMDGRFREPVTDFAGLQVKKKGDTQSADVEIIKYLAGKNTLFKKEKIEHSYPLCWRCDTPLLNYAANSWFVKVTAMKDDLVRINHEEIKWTPEGIRDGRFGKWLEGARDWAISRSRYWGAPIPVWRCDTCKEEEVVSSFEDIKKHFKDSPRNTYFVMRHGEAESNRDGILSSRVENPTHLTEKGRDEVAATAQSLGAKPDLIFASDFLRTKETAEIMAEALGIPKTEIIYDARLREINVGIFDGKSGDEYHSFFSSSLEKFSKSPEGGENRTDVKKRTMEFLEETDKAHEGKTILIVTHESPARMLFAGAKGLLDKEAASPSPEHVDYIKTAEIRELSFLPFPHNERWELDFHRPCIDTVVFTCKCGGEMRRVPEVFDCWFESGSMPFAQHHYPFENKEIFNPNEDRGFPAEFIAEGLDQTRGWFYNMLVLSVGIFGKAAFRHVVVNGLILAEDGQKMSKKLKNYPDPMEIVAKYGADALRYYLLSSPAVRGEDLNFSEKNVAETYRKNVARLENVLAFYEMYPVTKTSSGEKEKNVLDSWIFARLNQLISEVTFGLDIYELDKASRPIADFIDDLSTWWLRRSRERLKGKSGDDVDMHAARATLQQVLLELSKVIAPFMPFVAETVYKKAGGEMESVHLESWPKAEENTKDDEKILEEMVEVRNVVALGLEARAKAGIKVRQPLQEITVENHLVHFHDNDQLIDLIKEEVNIKEVFFVSPLRSFVELDTEITPELKEEGTVRELIRNLQEFRKESGMHPDEKDKTLVVEADEAGKKFVEKYREEIQRAALFAKIEFGDVSGGQEVKADEISLKVRLG